MFSRGFARVVSASTRFSTRSSLPSSARSFSSSSQSDRNTRLGKIFFGCAVLTLGLSYAAVPVYRAFCQRTGFGGTVRRVDEEEYKREVEAKQLGKKVGRPIKISFISDTAPDLHWKFVPAQYQLNVRVGEPALAFFVATNKLEYPITGVATYNVTPNKVGAYFRKIQCFW